MPFLFLTPTSRQFPHDAVCGQIVRALHAQNFQAEGFHIELRTYGTGQQKLRYVELIQSEEHDIRIRFGRPQGLLQGGSFNDVAAVNEVQLPRQILRVFEDESGPTLHRYVGDDWARDRTTWWSKPNARLHQESRRCVTYSGKYPRHPGVRPVWLVHQTDYREYAPEGEEPTCIDTDRVMEEFRTALETLRDTILKLPIAEKIDPVWKDPAEIPFPAGVPAGPFFTRGNARDVRRIERGQRNIDDLALADRYGLLGGLRLAPLNVRDVPKVAYDGFIWCSALPTASNDALRYDAFLGDRDTLIRITPKDARGIYVVDHAAYTKRRADLSAQLQGRDQFTYEEIADIQRARARTIVPILEYTGDYEDPLYLINRELGLDEVEVPRPLT